MSSFNKIFFVFCLVILVFSCKKQETINPNSPANYPPVFYGSGIWNIDLYIYYPQANSSLADTTTNYGVIQFVNDTLAILTPTGSTGSQLMYRLNEDKSMFILDFGAGDLVNAPVVWSNVNKMRLSFVDVQDDVSFQRIYIMSRTQ